MLFDHHFAGKLGRKKEKRFSQIFFEKSVDKPFFLWYYNNRSAGLQETLSQRKQKWRYSSVG